MKKMTALVAAMGLAVVSVYAEARVGKPAPDFEVKDVSGKTHKLSDYKGKIVVLENYNLDCPYVVNHYKGKTMQDCQKEATTQGVVWLVVNSNYKDADRVENEAGSEKLRASAIIYDPKGAIGKTYGFKTTPHMVVIDKKGAVAYNGAIDDKPDADHDPRKARNYVREAIAKLNAGEPVAVASTKPYGCSAKFAE